MAVEQAKGLDMVCHALAHHEELHSTAASAKFGVCNCKVQSCAWLYLQLTQRMRKLNIVIDPTVTSLSTFLKISFAQVAVTNQGRSLILRPIGNQDLLVS